MGSAAPVLPMTVAQVMSSPVVTVSLSTPYRAVVVLLEANRISAVAMLGGDGCPVGLISEEGMLLKVAGPSRSRIFERRRRRLERRRAEAQVAADVMSSPLPTVRLDSRLATAARRMHRLRVNHLGVEDDASELVGILSGTDLLKAFLRADEEVEAEIEQDLIEGWLAAEGAQLEVRVREGVVDLEGSVELRTHIPLLCHLVRQVDGVVAVHERIRYRTDDRRRGDRGAW